MMVHPLWRREIPDERAWKPDSSQGRRSARDVALEQDRAAGGRDARLVVLPDGREVRASIELKRQPKRRRIYANLRYSCDGRTTVKYVGEVTRGTREENLRQAWEIVRAREIIDSCAEGSRAER